VGIKGLTIAKAFKAPAYLSVFVFSEVVVDNPWNVAVAVTVEPSALAPPSKLNSKLWVDSKFS